MSETEAKPVEAPVEETPAPAAVETKEPSADAAVSRPGAAVFTILAFCMLTLFVVATPIDWIEQHSILGSTKITLFSTYTSAAGKQFVAQYVCEELRDRFRAVQAFAIISILLAAGALFAGISAIVKKSKLTLPLVLGVAVLVSSLIAWTMGLRIYYEAGMTGFGCSNVSYAQQKLEVGPGIALFITGWCFSLLAIFVAFKDPVLPPVIPDELVDAVASYIYAAFAFVGFVFVVIGTASNIVHFWIGQTTSITATMWKITQKVYGASANQVTKFDFDQFGTVVNGVCPDIDKYAKFAEAFAIIAIAFYLIAVIVGALFVLKKIGKAVPIIVGIFGTLFALLSVAACAVLYYGRFCLTATFKLSLHGLGFRLDAGVALLAAAVLLLAVATIILMLIALVQHISAGAKGGNVKPTAFLFLFGGVFSVFFLVLGASLTAFSKNADDFNYDRWSLWKQYTLRSGDLTITEFGCKEIQQRLVGAGGLIVISIILSAIAVIVGVAQLVNANLRKAASGVFLLSSLTQLVAWGLVVTVFTGSFCGNLFYTKGYKIGVGLGLTIASWCLTTTVSILNLIVGTD